MHYSLCLRPSQGHLQESKFLGSSPLSEHFTQPGIPYVLLPYLYLQNSSMAQLWDAFLDPTVRQFKLLRELLNCFF